MSARAVVVHRGARDGYQLALALAERDLLSRLVTDLYWPGDRSWAGPVARLAGSRAASALERRRHPALSSSLVRMCPFSGMTSLLLEKARALPFGWRRSATRWADRSLGSTAGRLARAERAAVVSCSYYAHSAFSQAGTESPRVLFQLHPHPASVRRILAQERADWPECAASLDKEWELSLPTADYATLVEETTMADAWLVASSFSKHTLIENGIDPRRVHVVPYGVNLDRFRPIEGKAPAAGRPLRLLFVGTITQRKGIRYLLEALRLLGDAPVELEVCGRAVDDLALFASFGDRVRVRPSVSDQDLCSAYRSADLFVFPSVAEGFGHVLLEAMASGLPVLSTTHTAAPDLITEGEDGFVVAPRRPDLLRDRIAWAMAHRETLQAMRSRARQKAESFTWARFREGVARVVQQSLREKGAPVAAPEAAYV